MAIREQCKWKENVIVDAFVWITQIREFSLNISDLNLKNHLFSQNCYREVSLKKVQTPVILFYPFPLNPSLIKNHKSIMCKQSNEVHYCVNITKGCLWVYIHTQLKNCDNIAHETLPWTAKASQLMFK